MHRIRGVLGTALTWAIVWLLVGLGVVLFLGEPNSSTVIRIGDGTSFCFGPCGEPSVGLALPSC